MYHALNTPSPPPLHEHIPQLDILDTKNSDTVTETAVQVANAVSRYLDDVESTFKQRQYDHAMCENMYRFRQQTMRIGTGIQTKVQPDYVRRINESYQKVDQEFDKVIKEFQ
ncbi:hypothetical protein HFD88_006728 [Aspergillus terreus]|nr:hypothetical protein HFD88_006728 [Aspergillus terreus]